MNLLIKSTLTAAAVDAVVGLVDAGDGTAQLTLFSGPAPLSITDDIDPIETSALVTFDLPSPAFGDAMLLEDAVEALAFSIETTEATDEGEVSFFRVYNKDGIAVIQGDTSDEGDPTCLVNQANVTLGAEINVLRLVVGMAI